MAPIQERDAIVKKVIRTALGDEDLDENCSSGAQICANAAMSIISALEDDDVFKRVIARFSANDQAVSARSAPRSIG